MKKNTSARERINIDFSILVFYNAHYGSLWLMHYRGEWATLEITGRTQSGTEYKFMRAIQILSH